MFEVVRPKYRLGFEVTRKHCKLAVRKDPCRCVVAQAMYDKFGEALASVQVLRTKTILMFMNGKVKEYRTPSELRDGLVRFDDTGVWDLPEGEYHLLPLRPSHHRDYEPERLRKQKYDENRPKRKYVKSGKFKQRPLNPRLISLRKISTKEKHS